MNERDLEIIKLVKQEKEISSRAIYEKNSIPISFATVKRILSKLVDENLLIKIGQGKSTRYKVSPTY